MEGVTNGFRKMILRGSGFEGRERRVAKGKITVFIEEGNDSRTEKGVMVKSEAKIFEWVKISGTGESMIRKLSWVNVRDREN